MLLPVIISLSLGGSVRSVLVNVQDCDILVSEFEFHLHYKGARGVMVIVVGNEHGDTSSNPGRDWLHFT